MKESKLPIDRTRHCVYSRKAKRCVQKLLRRCYDGQTAAQWWERIQMQYAAFLTDEPAMKDVRIKTSIYDTILFFAWYRTAPEKPPADEIQQDIFRCFFGSFTLLGKLFDLNRKMDNRLASRIFQKANDIREEEIKRFPSSFRMGSSCYDREKGIFRYSFTQCPNAEFARRHHLEEALPFLCNCDHLAMKQLHAVLIREGTCLTCGCCDYCIAGDKNPIAAQYELVKDGTGLLRSVKK